MARLTEGILSALRSAKEGFREFTRWWEAGVIGTGRTKDAVVRNLRQIPATDTNKKEKLAEYFQSEQGRIYSREEREDAYNQLLGRERNRDTH